MKLYSKSLVALLFLLGLYIRVDANGLSDTTGVLIINSEDVVPEGTKKIGKVKVTDGGFKSDCGYERTLEQAKEKAVKVGGNVVKITELKLPDGFSTCYRLFGEIYYCPDIPGLIAEKARLADSLTRTLLPDTASYALLYLYRPLSDVATAISYNVKLNDSVICRMKKNSRQLIRVYRKGLSRISARTESSDEVILNIQPGKAYFVNCSIGIGGFIGRPKLDTVDVNIGLREFNLVKDRKMEVNADAAY
ncbi:hypothetical protein [Chitinophaga sp. 212800010-3]|uniref:hypothetical protein n=1 Tax=unclassified Chitinophaga TaxID=2619133 RepID=UPI002DE42603|nr:DUF2846 domain-containing protein [Chitinophaga sp. 212800010-3]